MTTKRKTHPKHPASEKADWSALYRTWRESAFFSQAEADYINAHNGRLPPGMTMEVFLKKVGKTYGVNPQYPERVGLQYTRVRRETFEILREIRAKLNFQLEQLLGKVMYEKTYANLGEVFELLGIVIKIDQLEANWLGKPTL
jgi:hypothetical protein